MLSKAVLSLALLAGVSAQTTPVTTTTPLTYVQPQGQFLTQPTTYVQPTTYAPQTYVQQPQTYVQQPQYTTVPQTYYQPQVQTPVVNNLPSGPQYPQYKRWQGKACELIDLTLASTAAGYKTQGTIQENDLNGDLSCDTSNAAAAKIAFKLAGVEIAAAAAEDPDAFTVSAANCKIIVAKDEPENNAACLAKRYLTAKGTAAVDEFEPKTATCKVLSQADTNKMKAGEDKLIDQAKIDKCKEADIAIAKD